MVKIKNKNDIVHKTMGSIEIRELLSDKNCDMYISHNIMRIGEHHHEVEHEKSSEFVYVIRGSATAVINGETTQLKEGDFFFMPAGTRHMFFADSPEVEVISVFKAVFGSKGVDARMTTHNN